MTTKASASTATKQTSKRSSTASSGKLKAPVRAGNFCKKELVATTSPDASDLHIASVFERANGFDIIHNGFDFLPLTYSDLVDTLVVTTIMAFHQRA